ncbi:MAG: hypothetical protein EZS28_050711, partial [Streblomastix strix]
MKAIKEKSVYYEIIEETNDTYVTEFGVKPYGEGKRKQKLFNKSDVKVIELDSLPKKEKNYHSSKSTAPAKSKRPNYDFYINDVKTVLELTCSARSIQTVLLNSDVEEPEIVTSILSQANSKRGRISEKQIFIIAKFLCDNDININRQ